MLGILINCATFIVCLLWAIKQPNFDSLIALLCSISTLIGQAADKVVEKVKNKKINQKITSGNNSINTQIGTINT